MLFDEILAQKGPIASLRLALEKGQVAQAYLFEGPSGVGKQKAALALAATMICQNQPPGCGRCEICKRVLANNHPDMRIHPPREEGNRNLKVEFIREEILPFSKFAPFEAQEACLIFPQADVSFPAQHAGAANALLKTLEEPRSHVHFILLAERPERLLPTVRSRCQRVVFKRLPKEVLHKILLAEAIPEATAHTAAALADGRADRALELALDNKGEQLLDLALRIDGAVSAGKPAELLNLAEMLARSDDLNLILETLAFFYRDVALCSLGLPEQGLLFHHRTDLIEQRSKTIQAREAALRVDTIHQTCENLERNANAEIALDALLFELEHRTA